MPKVPKWMANAMESLFSGSYHPVYVTETDYLTPALKKITFKGDFSKLNRPFVAGNVIEFRISDTEFRHYTPSHFDTAQGICEVLFYLHEKGPGSHWASHLKKGDHIKLLGPGGRIRFSGQQGRHLCFGDETSLGLLKCIAAEAAEKNAECLCIAELDEGHLQWPALAGVTCIPVHKRPGTPAQEVIEKIKGWADQWEDTAFYLTGNAKSIQAVKKYLTEQGIPGKRIQTEPYWAEGKTGL